MRLALIFCLLVLVGCGGVQTHSLGDEAGIPVVLSEGATPSPTWYTEWTKSAGYVGMSELSLEDGVLVMTSATGHGTALQLSLGEMGTLTYTGSKAINLEGFDTVIDPNTGIMTIKIASVTADPAAMYEALKEHLLVQAQISAENAETQRLIAEQQRLLIESLAEVVAKTIVPMP